jgi:uncharacterized protein (TIGR02246 family)
MHTIRGILLCLTLLGLPLAAPADGGAKARAAVEAQNAKLSAAYGSADFKAVAALYTADAQLLPPDGDVIQGKDAIEAFWKATYESGVTGAKLTTLDVGRSGDLAYETGTALLTIQPKGKEPTTATLKYLVVWKKLPEQGWKLHRDIWNALPAKK